MVQTGVPLYGQGNVITLIANGFLPGDVRFGFEFQGGVAGKPGLSSANINHFSINGQVNKLGSMDDVALKPEFFGEIKTLKLEMRDKTAENKCWVEFESNFITTPQILLDSVSVFAKSDEIYEQGFISGWCSNEDQRF